MSNWFKYGLVGVGCTLITGIAGAVGMYSFYHLGYNRGYDKGYSESEPDYLIQDINKDGDDDLCLRLGNSDTSDVICSIDVDRDGAQDIVYIDGQTEKVKEVRRGKNRCLIPMPLEERIE